MAQPPRQAIRAFVALDLEATSLRRLARIADRLRMASGAPSATWTLPGRMHVTLKFMAALPADDVEPLASAVRALVEHRPAPEAGGLRLDAFPSAGQARLVVAAFEDGSGELTKLAERVDRVAAKLGVAREERPFRPHVTLARLKRPYDARRWLRPELATAAGSCRMAGVTLFRSELRPEGPSYVPLARFPFEASPDPFGP